MATYSDISEDCEDVFILRTPAFSSRLGDELVTLHILDGDFTDFILKAGDKAVECHRVIIAANSPHLKTMLKSNMKETKEYQACLDNISPNALDVVMKYMYTGETRIPIEVLKDVIYAADYLLMDELKYLCVDKACTNIQPNNVIGWFKLSVEMNLPELISSCSEVMTSHLKEIKSQQDFPELSISEITHYLSEAKESEEDPDALLGAGLDWISADSHTRCNAIGDMLKSVSMERCSLQCLKEEQQKHAALLNSDPKVYKLISDALMSMAMGGAIRKKRSSAPLLLVGFRFRL